MKTSIIAAIMLAQASPDAAIDRFLEFIAKVMMMVGAIMIFFGGWKIHRGEISEGLLAILGGFIVALAIPIIRFFFSL